MSELKVNTVDVEGKKKARKPKSKKKKSPPNALRAQHRTNPPTRMPGNKMKLKLLQEKRGWRNQDGAASPPPSPPVIGQPAPDPFCCTRDGSSFARLLFSLPSATPQRAFQWGNQLFNNHAASAVKTLLPIFTYLSHPSRGLGLCRFLVVVVVFLLPVTAVSRQRRQVTLDFCLPQRPCFFPSPCTYTFILIVSMSPFGSTL